MEKFEYLVARLGTGAHGFGWYGNDGAKVGGGNDLPLVLNAYGAQGWELVNSHAHTGETGRSDVHTLILKRKRG